MLWLVWWWLTARLNTGPKENTNVAHFTAWPTTMQNCHKVDQGVEEREEYSDENYQGKLLEEDDLASE